MGLFDIFSKRKDEFAKREPSPVIALDHIQHEQWHQYDILTEINLDWQTVLDWADYMIKHDIADVMNVTAKSTPNEEEIDFSLEYAFHEGVKNVPQFKHEFAMLGVSGRSRSLNMPIKAVWLTGTKTIRFFIMASDDEMMRIYATRAIKRTFPEPEPPKPSRLQQEIKKSADEFNEFRADESKYIPYLEDLWETKFTEDDKSAIMELIDAGNKTEAIKQCHLRTRIGLMQAKDLVEKILT